ncbi:hypothetical protein B7494_g5047 [Chlorociboria aeruginascens]|nr:hypothetical protein B7494_g5047 [Chlorociboria aeruginascens]
MGNGELINTKLSILLIHSMAPTRSNEYAYDLSIWEWIPLLSKATGITFRLSFKAVKALLGGSKNGLTFHRYIAYEGMRDYQGGLNAVGIQNLLPATSKTCEKFAKRNRIEHSKIELPDGTTAIWLGSRKASKIVVFFHGGGYMAPALPEHIAFAFGFANPSQKDVAVVVLQYSLASEEANHYPYQLQQATSLIEHLLHSEKLSPSAITLVGDSAGAHLLLSLILHLSHPNPLVSPLKMVGRFSGAVLISPWITMGKSSESMPVDKHKDILKPGALAYWARNFLGDIATDAWNSPLIAPAQWWSDVPVDEMVTMYGDDEILREDICVLCEKIKNTMSEDEKSTHLKFMREALNMAELALSTDETPVGCVFVLNGSIIGRGMNATNRTYNGTRHAEFLGLSSILSSTTLGEGGEEKKKYGPEILKECDLVFFGAVNDKFGGTSGVLNIHRANGRALKEGEEGEEGEEGDYEVSGGWLREEAIVMLRRFYVQENGRAPEPRNKKERVLKLEVEPMVESKVSAGKRYISPSLDPKPSSDDTPESTTSTKVQYETR